MAAGQGFKTFTTGEVLSASDVNGYLMQGVLVFASATARNSAITSPQEGQYSYLKDTNATEYYDGSAWVSSAPAPSGGSWSLLNAGGTALTGATTITVSGISGKNSLMIVMNAASTANASGANFGVRVNGLTTNVYYGVGQTNYTDSPYSYTMFQERNYGNTTNYLPLAKVVDGSSTASGSVTLSGCNSTGIKPHISVGAANYGANYGHRRLSLQGYIDATSAITSVSVFSDDGNFDAGTLYVYGA